MSLALLVPDNSVPGAAAASFASPSSPSAVQPGWQEDGVSGSVGVLAGMSPGWDRAELQQDMECRIKGKAMIYTIQQPCTESLTYFLKEI